jgi:putative membrane-bound dehydrogenase-like protein
VKKLLLPFLVYVLGISCQEKKPEKFNGLSTQAALQSFRIPAGFKVELVASEPLISDPVAMDLDEAGNIYVVELHGYPLDTTGSGAIKKLIDSDGDGIPDKSIVFASQLRLPTGIMRWKKGFIVVDVPQVYYMEDTNQDGVADIRRLMLDGIALTNPQHIANTPLYGLDNWIYLAHMGTYTPKISLMFSDSGSNVRFADRPSQMLPRNANGRNIRFKPDSFDLEMCSGQSQYGQSFDNWGHHFSVENADHIFNEVIAAKYLNRNPSLLIGDASDHISDHGAACKVFPVTINPENQLLTDLGVITSACGITWYNGGLFPDSFNNVVFVAEPQSNLIHADRVNDKNSSFIASRVYQQDEFFTSTDSWCRPVMMYIGPDGALYVLDYYRQIIEHPEWLSDSVINSGALYNGHDKGRIYRISPVASPKMNWCSRLKLGEENTEQWVQHLASPNIWWRRQSQRLLMDKNDPRTIAMVQKIFDTVKFPAARVHALWILEGMHGNSLENLQRALQDPEPGVRENAIQIAELHLADFPALKSDLVHLQNDPSPRVRLQLLCTLGALHDTDAESAKRKILLEDIDDRWVQFSALSSSARKEMELMKSVIPVLGSKHNEGMALFFSNCATAIGFSKRAEDIRDLINLACSQKSTASSWWQAACLNGLSMTFSEKGIPKADFSGEKLKLLSLFKPTTEQGLRQEAIMLLSILGQPQKQAWNQAVSRARVVAADPVAATAYRADACRILGMDKSINHAQIFENIIEKGTGNDTLTGIAIISFNAIDPKSSCESIIRNWNWLSAPVRQTAMEVFLSSEENANRLLAAIQKKQILPAAISWPDKVSLMNHDNENIRIKSRELLTAGIAGRDEIVKKYKNALALKGDTAQGLVVFKNVCASCHNMNGLYGHEFGPDLGTVRSRDAESIMTDILNPNRSIATSYDLYMITLANGQKISGVISSQTPSSITLKNIGGKTTTLSRSDYKLIETSTNSAMPVGLETSINEQQMADLIAFIKQSR